MQNNLGPSLDDPLIRWRRRLDLIGTDLRRKLWIHVKLSSFYRQQLVSLTTVALLLAMLNPVNVAEAADASGPTSVDRNSGMADFSFDSIEEVPVDLVANNIGFISKPIVLATTIGKPETQQLAEQAQRKAVRKRHATHLASTTVSKPAISLAIASTSIGNVITGNTYPYGYCTWYAKSRRPDMPNHLGNARLWLMNAGRSGFSTGSTPQVGAIVVTSESKLGHVGYVEEVTDDEIVVSDMNVIGWGKLSRRHMKINSAVIKGYIY